MDLSKQPDFPVLDFNVIREPLETSIQSCINQLDRSWPPDLQDLVAANVLLESLVRANYNAYRSILFLCADRLEGGRRREYALSAGPLNRTILDSLFTVIFAFEDIAKRSDWYFQSGWRELKEEHERYRTQYENDPAWSEWLSVHSAMVEGSRVEWGIPEDLAANYKRINWWPNPGKMKRDKGTSAERREYLNYLNDWFYKGLSSESHLSWPGLVMRSAALMPRQDEEVRKWRLDKQRSDNVGVAIVLILALVSEIEIEINLGLSARLKFIWGILNGYYGLSKELYEHRYEGLL